MSFRYSAISCNTGSSQEFEDPIHKIMYLWPNKKTVIVNPSCGKATHSPPLLWLMSASSNRVNNMASNWWLSNWAECCMRRCSGVCPAASATNMGKMLEQNGRHFADNIWHAFLRMKIVVFWIKLYWSLFQHIGPIDNSHHWFSYWLGV